MQELTPPKSRLFKISRVLLKTFNSIVFAISVVIIDIPAYPFYATYHWVSSLKLKASWLRFSRYLYNLPISFRKKELYKKLRSRSHTNLTTLEEAVESFISALKQKEEKSIGSKKTPLAFKKFDKLVISKDDLEELRHTLTSDSSDLVIVEGLIAIFEQIEIIKNVSPQKPLSIYEDLYQNGHVLDLLLKLRSESSRRYFNFLKSVRFQYWRELNDLKPLEEQEWFRLIEKEPELLTSEKLQALFLQEIISHDLILLKFLRGILQEEMVKEKQVAFQKIKDDYSYLPESLLALKFSLASIRNLKYNHLKNYYLRLKKCYPQFTDDFEPADRSLLTRQRKALKFLSLQKQALYRLSSTDNDYRTLAFYLISQIDLICQPHRIIKKQSANTLSQSCRHGSLDGITLYIFSVYSQKKPSYADFFAKRIFIPAVLKQLRKRIQNYLYLNEGDSTIYLEHHYAHQEQVDFLKKFCQRKNCQMNLQKVVETLKKTEPEVLVKENKINILIFSTMLASGYQFPKTSLSEQIQRSTLDMYFMAPKLN